MLFLAVALALDTPALKPGRYEETLKEGAVSRVYVLRIPKKADGKAKLPLVVVLHDWTATAEGAETYTQMGVESEKEGFVAAFPASEGLGWNAGFKNLGAPTADDVIFIDHVVTDIAKRTPVDPKRIYLVGHGNGGMMAYVAASRLSERIAAIGVVGGTLGFDQGDRKGQAPTPTKPISAIIIHGKLDPNVPYDHGKGLGEGQPLMPDAMSALASATAWAKADGITSAPKTVDSNSPNVEILDWRQGVVEVELATILNGDHEWPGGIGRDGPEAKTGVLAAALIWKFLAAHPKP